MSYIFNVFINNRHPLLLLAIAVSVSCPHSAPRVDYHRFEVINATAMTYEYVASINRTVIDHAMIIQDLSAEWVK